MVAARAERLGSPILVDVSRWPVIVTTPPPRVTDEELQHNFDEFHRILRERPGPYVSVLDLRVCRGLTNTQRRMMTDSIADAEAVQERSPCHGVAMVFSSRVLQRVLTAILWVRRPRYPTKVFAKLEDALAWARAQLPQTKDLEHRTTELPTQARGPWRVFVGTFTSATEADECADTLRGHGIEPASRGYEGRYEVWAQGYSARTDAMLVRERLRALGLEATVSRTR